MSELQEVEALIANCKKVITQAAALKRMQKNKDFKLLFIDNYIKDQSIHLVSCKARPNVDQAELDKCIMAVSYFSLFLDQIEEHGAMAKDKLIEHEKTKLEILSEQEDI